MKRTVRLGSTVLVCAVLALGAIHWGAAYEGPPTSTTNQAALLPDQYAIGVVAAERSVPPAAKYDPNRDTPAKSPVSVFRLKHQSAAGLAEALHRIYPTCNAQADQTTNSLVILNSTPQATERIKQYIAYYDLSREEKGALQQENGVPEHVREFLAGNAKEMLPPVESPTPKPTQPAWSTQPMYLSRAEMSLALKMGGSEASIRERYHAAESRAQSLASALREKARAGVNAGQDERQACKDAVAEAFETRQDLLRVEINEMRQRIDRLSGVLEDRERHKDAVIARRFDELLQPNLKWDAANPRGADSQSTPKISGSTAQPTPTKDGR